MESNYADRSGLKIEGRGRMLVAHQSGYQEWAAGARVSLDLGRDKQGLAVSVTPSYGQTASGVPRLWQDGVAQRASTAPAGTVEQRISIEGIVRF